MSRSREDSGDNWSHAGSVQVDLTGVVKPGDRYEIMDAQKSVRDRRLGFLLLILLPFPMNGLVAAQPVGPGSGQGQGTRTSHRTGIRGIHRCHDGLLQRQNKVLSAGPVCEFRRHNVTLAEQQRTACFALPRVPVPSTAVDSVNIEIRNSATNPTMRVFVPAWLLTDGTIRDFADTTRDLPEVRRCAFR